MNKLNIFKFISCLFILFFFYLVLVAVDILLPRIPKILSTNYKESQKIIKERQIQDNQSLNIINTEILPYVYTQDYNLHPSS
jgi:fucose permease